MWYITNVYSDWSILGLISDYYLWWSYRPRHSKIELCPVTIDMPWHVSWRGGVMLWCVVQGIQGLIMRYATIITIKNNLYIMRWFVPDSVTLWLCDDVWFFWPVWLVGRQRPCTIWVHWPGLWLIRRWLYSVQYSTCVLYTQRPPNVYTQPPPRRHFPWGSFSTCHILHRGPNRG